MSTHAAPSPASPLSARETVGATIAYAAMVRGLAHELVPVDAMPEKSKSEAKDLTHGSMSVPSVRSHQATIVVSYGRRETEARPGALT